MTILLPVKVIAPEEIVDPNVDEHSVMTYLSQFPKAKLKPGAPVRPKTLHPNRARAYGPGEREKEGEGEGGGGRERGRERGRVGGRERGREGQRGSERETEGLIY